MTIPRCEYCGIPIRSQPVWRNGVKSRRRYCSRKCAAQVNTAKFDHAHYQRIGQMGKAARRAKGIAALRPMELRLMASGRFQEAARAIYDRAYGSGWMAGRRGQRQLPAKKASAA